MQIKESPTFIKNRLIASGIRPINNVVDISNYVMLELGQPLHFYDADKLQGCIEVRMAEAGEKTTFSSSSSDAAAAVLNSSTPRLKMPSYSPTGQIASMLNGVSST